MGVWVKKVCSLSAKAPGQNIPSAFLKENKFKDLTAPKKTMFKTTYPIHCAAKHGDEQMVKMLLEEGVDPRQKNSSGKTAVQVAQKNNQEGSHAGVLRCLGGA